MSGPANCVSQKTFELYVTASGFSKPWSPESRDLFWFYGKVNYWVFEEAFFHVRRARASCPLSTTEI